MGGYRVLWVVGSDFAMFWAFRRREGVVMGGGGYLKRLTLAGCGWLGVVGGGWGWLGVVGGDITV